MKAAIYGRVSTMGKGQDVDLQLRDLRSYAQARGWKIFREYVDNGISGRKDKRPALDQLMNDARAGIEVLDKVRKKFSTILAQSDEKQEALNV